MKKKIIASLLCVMVAGSMLTGCGSTTSSTSGEFSNSGSTTEQNQAEGDATEVTDPTAPIKVECDAGTLEYLSYEMVEDYEGNPAVVIHFQYTNQADESQMAMTAFSTKVFQNGVQCETAILLTDSDAITNAMKEVQKGASLEVGFAYKLQDTTNTLTLEAEEFFSFSGETYTQEIPLQ